MSCLLFRFGYSVQVQTLSKRRDCALSISMNALTRASKARPFADALPARDARTSRTSRNDDVGSCSYSGKYPSIRYCGSLRFTSPPTQHVRHVLRFASSHADHLVSSPSPKQIPTSGAKYSLPTSLARFNVLATKARRGALKAQQSRVVNCGLGYHPAA